MPSAVLSKYSDKHGGQTCVNIQAGTPIFLISNTLPANYGFKVKMTAQPSTTIPRIPIVSAMQHQQQTLL